VKAPLLSILIASIPSRRHVRERLLRVLAPQLEPRVEVIVDERPRVLRGSKRQQMLKRATGDYVVFIDDDDLVATDYVPRLLEACALGQDCCSMLAQVTTGVGQTLPGYVSIEYAEWRQDGAGYYRSPNHISPVRRQIALQAGFPSIDFGEDAEFSQRLYPLIETEAITPGETPLYHYFAGREVRRTSSKPSIVLKWATRSRPRLFARTMAAYQEKLSGRYDVRFVVSVDSDDPTRGEVANICAGLKARVATGPPRTKIAAINADLEHEPFDIVVAIADDMVPVVQDFDEHIVNDMARTFPSCDGLLLYRDGHQQTKPGHLPIATMPVMGRRLWEKLGRNIYNPRYKSLFCDDELTAVAERMGAAAAMPQLLIRHEWVGKTSRDALLNRNEALWNVDQKTFERRRKRGFLPA